MICQRKSITTVQCSLYVHSLCVVHRIGRTGRCGKTGVATTFINKSCSEVILLDLKHLLIESKQRVPNILLALKGPNEIVEDENTEGIF